MLASLRAVTPWREGADQFSGVASLDPQPRVQESTV